MHSQDIIPFLPFGFETMEPFSSLWQISYSRLYFFLLSSNHCDATHFLVPTLTSGPKKNRDGSNCLSTQTVWGGDVSAYRTPPLVLDALNLSQWSPLPALVSLVLGALSSLCSRSKISFPASDHLGSSAPSSSTRISQTTTTISGDE